MQLSVCNHGDFILLRHQMFSFNYMYIYIYISYLSFLSANENITDNSLYHHYCDYCFLMALTAQNSASLDWRFDVGKQRKNLRESPKPYKWTRLKPLQPWPAMHRFISEVEQSVLLIRAQYKCALLTRLEVILTVNTQELNLANSLTSRESYKQVSRTTNLNSI